MTQSDSPVILLDMAWAMRSLLSQLELHPDQAHSWEQYHLNDRQLNLCPPNLSLSIPDGAPQWVIRPGAIC